MYSLFIDSLSLPSKKIRGYSSFTNNIVTAELQQMQKMGSLGQEILAANLYSHYSVGFGKPPAKSEPQLSFSCKLERMFCRDSLLINILSAYMYVLRDA